MLRLQRSTIFVLNLVELTKLPWLQRLSEAAFVTYSLYTKLRLTRLDKTFAGTEIERIST